MDYPPDAFNALLAEVETQSGALLADPCLPQDVEYKGKGYSPSVQEGVTCGCRNLSRMVVLYEPDEQFAQPGSGYATVCAVCDSMGAWPKFCESVYAVDPTLDPAYGEKHGEDDDD